MSALLLRIIACVAMLMDHIGFQYNIHFFRCVGRIAFPIFVFLICNGYRHTSNRWHYALRLGIFALISQVPFSLFCYNRLWQSNGNVFVTLVLCLLCIWTFDVLIRNIYLRFVAFLPVLFICGLYYFGFLDSDYGIRGFLFSFVFYLFAGMDKNTYWIIPIGMLLAIYYPFLIACVKLPLSGMTPSLSSWEITQVYSLCALPIIFLYNGKRGQAPSSPILAKLTQLGFYIFYPVHMLALWLIRVF